MRLDQRLRAHKIIERHRDGMTLRVIATEFGITPQRVQQIVAAMRSLYREGLEGMEFGWLTVKAIAGAGAGQTTYSCVCRCGAIITVRREKLIVARQRSCGCRRADPAVRRAAASKVSAADKHRRTFRAGVAVRWRSLVRRYLRDKRKNRPAIPLCGHETPQRECNTCQNRIKMWGYLQKRKVGKAQIGE
jgi:hypothetical protein